MCSSTDNNINDLTRTDSGLHILCVVRCQSESDKISPIGHRRPADRCSTDGGVAYGIRVIDARGCTIMRPITSPRTNHEHMLGNGSAGRETRDSTGSFNLPLGLARKARH